MNSRQRAAKYRKQPGQLRVQWRVTAIKPPGYEWDHVERPWIPGSLYGALKKPHLQEAEIVMDREGDAMKVVDGLKDMGMDCWVEPVALVTVRRNEVTQRWEVAS